MPNPEDMTTEELVKELTRRNALPRCPCGKWQTYVGAYDKDGYTLRCHGCLRAIGACRCLQVHVMPVVPAGPAHSQPSQGRGAPMSKLTVAVDLDGVVHWYRLGWRDGSMYDEPMPGAFDALRRLRKRFDVVIFTARAVDGAPLDPKWAVKDQTEDIRQWFRNHGGEDLADLKITNRKPAAFAYVDDRAIHFKHWAQAEMDVSLAATQMQYVLE